jgi:TRAP-type C4-dicarboxylate transport system permease small subunit
MIGTIDRLCRWGGALAAFSLLTLFTIRLLEIFFRAVLDLSSPLIGEYSEYLLMAVFLLGAGHVMRKGGHIRVSLLADKVPARWGVFFGQVANWAGFGVGLFAALSMSRFALGTLQRGTLSYHASATPLWIPQSVAAVGFWLLCLALLANAMERRHTSAGRAEKIIRKQAV